MNTARILFVEDDRSGREMGVYNLKKGGYEVDAASSGREALELFDPERHDAVVTDVRMPGMSGIDLLKEIRARTDQIPVLVITAYAEVDVAVDAMKAGAFDFIGKPFHREHLLLTVQKAVERRRLLQQVRNLAIRAGGVERPLVFASLEMQRVIEMGDRIAGSDAPVLITGESGTGKELLARRIHVHSRRADKPFMAINLSAIPETLVESELFGHIKGAFTGASHDRVGRLRQAEGGTVFLDEIGELAPGLQVKLLRMLQEKVVDVVGQDSAAPIDVRFVTATNRSLADEIASGRFREDLFYRLSVIELPLPALRDRTADIEPLARHFVDLYAEGRDFEIPAGLGALLRRYPWPGNVRELENVCRRLVLLATTPVLDPDHLPDGIRATDRPSPDPLEDWPPLPEDGLSLIDLEKRIIGRVLRKTTGNVSQAAVYLGIPRHVLAYRMEKYGITRPE